MNILAVIPARGGSKRIPAKNMATIGPEHRPMLDYTIQAAREAKHIHSVVVSTDDLDIMRYAVRQGADSVLRQKELGDDWVPAWHCIRPILGQPLKRWGEIEAVALLLPTCPLRTADDIDEAIERWTGRDTGCSLISVTKLHGEAVVKEQANGWLKQPRLGVNQGVFFSNGGIQLTSLDTIRAYAARLKNPFRMPKTIRHELPWDRGIDVDTEDQLRLVDFILRGRA